MQCKKCSLVLNQTGFSKEEVNDFYNHDYQKTNSFKRGTVVTPREHYELMRCQYMVPVAGVSSKISSAFTGVWWISEQPQENF